MLLEEKTSTNNIYGDFSPIPAMSKTLNKILKKQITIVKWNFNLIVFVAFWIGFASGTYLTIFSLQSVSADSSGSGYYRWTFDSSGDYVLSDSNSIEVTGNTARLKVKNYVSDANTIWLGHVDSATGPTLADSSDYGNAADLVLPAPTPATTWTTGRLDGAGNGLGGLLLDGQSVYASVSAAVPAITQANTIESWVKFNSALSTTSSYMKQPIVDKGDYQLYYDNQTAKLVYELAPSTTQNWTQIAANELNRSWDLNGINAVSSATQAGTLVYAGTGNSVGDARVYFFDTVSNLWTSIGGNGQYGSWSDNTYDEVVSIVAHGNNIVAGMGNGTGDADVWYWNSTTWTWTKIGGDSGGSSAGYSWDTGYERAEKLLTIGNYLIVGLGYSSADAELWSCDMGSDGSGCTTQSGWAKIGGDSGSASAGYSWNAGYDRVWSLANIGSVIYVGIGDTAGEAEVWSCDTGATCTRTVGWTKVGGDAVGSSWNTGYEAVTSLTIYNGTILLAGLGLTSGATTHDAEIWSCDTSTTNNCTDASAWTNLVDGNSSGADGQAWTNAQEAVVSMLVHDAGSDKYLYVGLGISNTDADYWVCNIGTSSCLGSGTGWTKLGGDGANSSWTGNYTYARAQALVGSTLYVGVVGANIAGSMYSYSGSWSHIGGNYHYGSWDWPIIDTITTSTVHNNKLYTGTGLGVAGDAMVWEYDGASASGSYWQLVGGQNTRSPNTSVGWGYNTYEQVVSLNSFKGNLYAGLGNTADDGDVYRYDGNSWVIVGGTEGATTVNSSWADADNIEQVFSMTSDNDYLYVGLGNTDDDGDVWRFDGTTWEQIGGVNTGGTTINGGWANADNVNTVLSLLRDGKYLYAGLGSGTDEGEVWRLDLTAGTLDWEQIGGLGAASYPTTWQNIDNIEGVYSMAIYNGELYAALGNTSGDAKIWKFDGTTWTMVAGNGAAASYTSWGGSDYEIIWKMEVYSGLLYASLGTTAGDAEVWVFDGSSWTQIGGDGFNGSWLATDNFESVYSLINYRGKLYATTGISSAADATVWSYGSNIYLESDGPVATSTNWHHLAATYDGTTAHMYLDGTQQQTAATASMSLKNSGKPLHIGASLGGGNNHVGRSYLNAVIDEIRISDTARSSFNTTPYSTSVQWVRPATAKMTSQVADWSNFYGIESGTSSAVVRYQLSSDGGGNWQYHSANWIDTTDTAIAHANTEAQIRDNIGSFPATAGGMLWRALFYSSDGQEQTSVSNIQLEGVVDSTPPTDPSDLHVRIASASGSLMAGGTGNWYNTSSVYVDWELSTDTGGSGVLGYYAYFGTDNTAEPTQEVDPSLTANRTFTSLTNGTYYLKLLAKDNAQNVSGTVPSPLVGYQIDIASPNSPTALTVSPSGYSSDNSYTFSWPVAGTTGGATDSGGSSIQGYKYCLGPTCLEAGGPWSSVITTNTVSLTDAAYSSDEANVFYLVAVDNAGNESSSPSQINYYYAGSGPSAPQYLTATPQSNTANLFSFSWQPPASYSGSASELTYCYVVGTPPNANNCTFTSAGDTSLSADAFATEYGLNTMYVVAKNSESAGGAINYAAYGTASFTAYTTAPGIPLNLDVADISVKNSSTWRLTISWNPPTSVGSGIANYQIVRSTDGTNYTALATTTGTAYVDVGLIQVTYYYKVKACDSVSNCGVFTGAENGLPTGKYTEAATLTSGPTTSSITTKKATITWSTDRSSDSKIQYGTSAGTYGTTEPSNSTQVTDHPIELTNLSPGTTYYYKAKWTDEDGNTGTSAEKSFSTQAAPSVKDVGPHTIGLTSAVLHYTTLSSSKVRIYYGETTAFGGVKEVITSTSEQEQITEIIDLKDGTKYYYKINTFDSESAEYEGTILNFTTLPRPKISKVRIQQVVGTAQPTVLTTWDTNTDTSSIVTYYPEGKLGSAKDEVNVNLVSGAHRMIIRGLVPQTPYVLQVKGRDKAGNEATSELQKFTTATDTRPPQISDMKVEGSVQNLSGSSNGESTAQLIVSWNTDEPSTSQVEFGEGTGTTYAQKTQEDASLTYNHLVVISGLTPSKVYHLRALSKDTASNTSPSIDTVTITPKATENALNLVISNLQQAFGFLGQISQ